MHDVGIRKQRSWWVVPALTAVASSGLAAQDLAAKLRASELGAAHGDALRAAVAAIDTPSARDVNGLLALIQAGHSAPSPAPQIGELAYAVVGWWSILDSGIANGLLDRFEYRDWPKIQKPLLELATLGVTDGAKRARKWLGSTDAKVQLDGLQLLRRVGGDPSVIKSAIRQGLESPLRAHVAAALELMWDYVVASDELRKLLEAKFDELTDWPERYTMLWAMARGGAFRTEWMLAQWRRADAEQRANIDYAMGQATTDVVLRLIGELPKLADDASRQIVLDWLEPAAQGSAVRHALMAAASKLESLPRRMIDVVLARQARAAPELRSHWCARLASDDPGLQRVACQALVPYGAKAVAHVDRLVAILQGPQPKGSRLYGSALLALAAIGKAAGSAEAAVSTFLDSDDKHLVDMAKRVLPRIGKSALLPMPLPFDDVAPRTSWRRSDATDEQVESIAAQLAVGVDEPGKLVRGLVAGGALPRSAIAIAMLGRRCVQGDGRACASVLALKMPQAEVVLYVPRLLSSWLGEAATCRSPSVGTRCLDWPEFYGLPTVREDDSIRPPDDLLCIWSQELSLDCLVLDRLGKRRTALAPMLEWLAPRRPLLFRDWFAGWKSQ